MSLQQRLLAASSGAAHADNSTWSAQHAPVLSAFVMNYADILSHTLKAVGADPGNATALGYRSFVAVAEKSVYESLSTIQVRAMRFLVTTLGFCAFKQIL